MYSILRYAIAIEIMMSILLPFFIFHIYSEPREQRGLISITVACAIVTLTILTTHAPELGRIRHTQQVFEINAPKLPDNSVVILADEPLGFLAPFLYDKQPTTRFVGVPYYLSSRKEPLLSQTINAIIHSSKGPVFVAYYAKTPPAFDWLSEKGVKVNVTECRTISTNISPDVRLCSTAIGNSALPVPAKFQLTADTATKKGVQFAINWPSNSCAAPGQTGKIGSFDWNITVPRIDQAMIVVQQPPTNVWSTLTIGEKQGSATTGEWVQPGLVFQLRTQSGKELATARIRYQPCE